MWKKFKELTSMDKYNTPSKLFLYFLSTYGKDYVAYKRVVNTCELIRLTFGALFGIALAFALSFGFSFLFFQYFMFIALWIGIGFTGATLCEIPTISFVMTNGAIITLAILFTWDNTQEFRSKMKKASKKEKSIFGLWMESITKKVCIEIDLDKYR